MKQRRVGTFSLGILMVLIGVLILTGSIKGKSGVLLILKFWPVILISIGIEILYFVYKNKQEEVKLKYDVLSVFIFIIMVLISSGIFIFNEFMNNELANVVMQNIKSESHSDIKIEEYEYLKKDVKKIVAENRGNIYLKQSGDNKIRLKASVVVKAVSKELAKEYTEKVIEINLREENLYISDFNERALKELVEIGEIETYYEIYVPEGIEVEINNVSGYIEVGEVNNKLEINTRNSNLNIKYDDKNYKDIEIDGVYSNIEIYIPKEQEGHFYFESDNYISIENKKLFDESDRKSSENNEVIEKKIGEGPIINVRVKNTSLEIK